METKKEEIKMCPFRKIKHMSDMVNNTVTAWEEDFIPCIKEECMAYETEHPFFDNYTRKYCKLMRK